eukprot:6533084-Lingulodinium_polyedra.AAC.1
MPCGNGPLGAPDCGILLSRSARSCAPASAPRLQSLALRANSPHPAASKAAASGCLRWGRVTRTQASALGAMLGCNGPG